MHNAPDRNRLVDVLATRFSRAERRALLNELAVALEDVTLNPATAREEAWEIVRFFERRGSLDLLMEKVDEDRPQSRPEARTSVSLLEPGSGGSLGHSTGVRYLLGTMLLLWMLAVVRQSNHESARDGLTVLRCVCAADPPDGVARRQSRRIATSCPLANRRRHHPNQMDSGSPHRQIPHILPFQGGGSEQGLVINGPRFAVGGEVGGSHDGIFDIAAGHCELAAEHPEVDVAGDGGAGREHRAP